MSTYIISGSLNESSVYLPDYFRDLLSGSLSSKWNCLPLMTSSAYCKTFVMTHEDGWEVMWKIPNSTNNPGYLEPYFLKISTNNHAWVGISPSGSTRTFSGSLYDDLYSPLNENFWTDITSSHFTHVSEFYYSQGTIDVEFCIDEYDTSQFHIVMFTRNESSSPSTNGLKGGAIVSTKINTLDEPGTHSWFINASNVKQYFVNSSINKWTDKREGLFIGTDTTTFRDPYSQVYRFSTTYNPETTSSCMTSVIPFITATSIRRNYNPELMLYSRDDYSIKNLTFTGSVTSSVDISGSVPSLVSGSGVGVEYISDGEGYLIARNWIR